MRINYATRSIVIFIEFNRLINPVQTIFYIIQWDVACIVLFNLLL